MSDTTLFEFDYKSQIEKKKLYGHYMKLWFDKTINMFSVEGLPDTTPERDFKLMLQKHGHLGVIEHNGNIYCLPGQFAGILNQNYMPTQYIIVNPYLDLSKTFTIDDDVIIIPNDSLYSGLFPLHSKYAKLYTETDISIRNAIINTRFTQLIKGNTDQAKKSADKYIRDIIDGELSVVADNPFIEGITTMPLTTASNNNYLSQLIEIYQYLKSSHYNEIGINSNYNMKREALNSAESALNDDVIKPFIFDMFETQTAAFEKVNSKFDLSFSLSYNDPWGAVTDPDTDPETPEDRQGGDEVETND